eukprot:5905615-Pleurochrysis_carterae.AAC.1
MGCGGSKEDVEAQPVLEETPVSVPNVQSEEAQEQIQVIETLQIDETKPSETTFIASVLRARQLHSDNVEIMTDCCTRLQSHNRGLKNYIAIADAQ